MALRARALGLAIGIVVGVGLLFTAIGSGMLGGQGVTISYLAQFVPGYGKTFLGVVLGMISGFIEGFIVGVVIAWLYNRFHKLLYKSEATR